ncbi:protein of unknown function (DUF1707) [Actinoalloteichus cyanogriseus DSM 43889]|uniref:DUF1707 domain-containing protein n=1 Tax=Actinoalloteichus caeruleus DSM 43889 TaxID=1120930 RepID=A0ABT1JLG4_ACTCY|nr:protein of unknown function (DUF1707) [Actinoalloteichus caeruleus DSM 43889]
MRVTATNPVAPRYLRVSDAERQHVVGLLQKAIGLGLIDLDEFTTRTDSALTARTRGDLNSLLVDLPGLSLRAGAEEPESMTLSSHGSSLVREGHWRVPTALRVENQGGVVRLDFTQAEFAGETVLITVAMRHSHLVLTVPEGIAVQDEVTSKHSVVRLRDLAPASAFGRRIVLRGELVHSSLRAGRPGRRWSLLGRR